jgi:hypothetical protein
MVPGDRLGTARNVTNVQLYFAIGLPSVLALVNIGITLVLFTNLSSRIQGVEQRLIDLTGAINDLDKRLIKVEIKLGIQP